MARINRSDRDYWIENLQAKADVLVKRAEEPLREQAKAARNAAYESWLTATADGELYAQYLALKVEIEALGKRIESMFTDVKFYVRFGSRYDYGPDSVRLLEEKREAYAKAAEGAIYQQDAVYAGAVALRRSVEERVMLATSDVNLAAIVEVLLKKIEEAGNV